MLFSVQVKVGLNADAREALALALHASWRLHGARVEVKADALVIGSEREAYTKAITQAAIRLSGGEYSATV